MRAVGTAPQDSVVRADVVRPLTVDNSTRTADIATAHIPGQLDVPRETGVLGLDVVGRSGTGRDDGHDPVRGQRRTRAQHPMHVDGRCEAWVEKVAAFVGCLRGTPVGIGPWRGDRPLPAVRIAGSRDHMQAPRRLAVNPWLVALNRARAWSGGRMHA